MNPRLSALSTTLSLNEPFKSRCGFVMNATPTTSLVTANNGGSEADTTNPCPFHQPKPVQWDATPAWIDIDNWDLAPFTGPTKATAPSFDVTEDSWRHQLSDDIVARRETEEKSGWHSRATEDASAWGVGRLEYDGHCGFGFNPFASDDDEETAHISPYPSSTYPSPDASSPTTGPATPTSGRYSSLSLGGVPLAHLNCDTPSGSRGPASKAKAQYGPITRPTKK
ncbi:hypothetical protein NEOLEDRAFT_1139265 [Neolentinus lepideus HHB14362 ss-1]|uniref:Uncharacterized protein n=1 Tax=Neolentinus lepideus HHB14362 ss-1 TaxID=1314782 RepID=A0A165PSW2_9AGAM|nr:hypothetical protein NEOLEDRAFT_1139265 [Neolentinus lepideus HHB14362 ss-1]